MSSGRTPYPSSHRGAPSSSRADGPVDPLDPAAKGYRDRYSSLDRQQNQTQTPTQQHGLPFPPAPPAPLLRVTSFPAVDEAGTGAQPAPLVPYGPALPLSGTPLVHSEASEHDHATRPSPGGEFPGSSAGPTRRPVDVHEILKRRKLLIHEDLAAVPGPALPLPPGPHPAQPPGPAQAPLSHPTPFYSAPGPASVAPPVSLVPAGLPSVPMPASQIQARKLGPKIVQTDREVTAFTPAALRVKRAHLPVAKLSVHSQSSAGTAATTSRATDTRSVVYSSYNGEGPAPAVQAPVATSSNSNSNAVDDVYLNFMKEIDSLGGGES